MDENRAPERRPYRAPSLVVYGEVRELTAGGTGNAAEGAPGPDPRKWRP
jgi:hypothetical protein